MRDANKSDKCDKQVKLSHCKCFESRCISSWFCVITVRVMVKSKPTTVPFRTTNHSDDHTRRTSKATVMIDK